MRHFAVQLNHLPPELNAVLPPTDSRRRPDTRAIEVGRFQKVGPLLLKVEKAHDTMNK